MGHGRRRSSSGTIRTTIAKSTVKKILKDGAYDICQWKRSRCKTYRDCDLTAEELKAALNDENTYVSVANTVRAEYMPGYKTIVIEAPVLKANVVLRIEL